MTGIGTDRWFNRFIEYWTLPRPAAVLDHVRRGRVQLVQMGNFGPDFYSMATDDTVARSWAGMPGFGIQENLDLAADLIPQIQGAGAVVVGQLTMTMHFGDHQKRVGLFGEPWEQMWTPSVLGPAPFDAVDTLVHLDDTGDPEPRIIEGRPHATYRGCVRNPGWRQVLKAMVSKGIDLGLDGFNAIHNYETFCHCQHCTDYIRAHLQRTQALDASQLRALFGTDDTDAIQRPLSPAEVDETTQRRYAAVIEHAASLSRKDAFDDVFIDHGRRLRPNLWLAQWYHKYGLRVNEERCGLPMERWAQAEDYIWYSQGPYRWGSSLDQGYLADMGLPSRFMHAAGGGRPFVVNKYDYRRWRVWAAEATAHGGAALAYHAGPPAPEENAQGQAPEDYYGPVIRAQRFLADQEPLLHPATPWSQVGLVYPRCQERDSELECVDAFKRIGEWLEDAKILFDAVLDEDLVVQAANYQALILPDIVRLTPSQVAALQAVVEGGGVVVITDQTGRCDAEGGRYATDPLVAWRWADGDAPVLAVGTGKVIRVPAMSWQPTLTPIHALDDVEMPVYARLPDDLAGQVLVSQLDQSLGGYWLRSDAPWYVRVRAWRPTSEDALVVHWINYLQDEQAVAETPIPIGPIDVEMRLPQGKAVEAIDWRYPEMKAPQEIQFESTVDGVRFCIPRLIVHGMAVLRLAS
ncbi:MAG: hypothetical protein HN712_17695 [Gemmatimonadetes bacterium]|nr:hypothetical protein [Gemmatimonadota bacterium]MBT6145286.1 hypothetical protein [Gemmatimonadota bacterium]MBT7862155.1 hypothetical protein [Gemmatimonadota bacterium]